MRILKKCGKVLAAGVTAFVLLCLLCAFYYRTPMYETNRLGNTDFAYAPGARWMQMTEGMSWGRFDDWGFNNPEVIENPDILVLGSSHMEATYMQQQELLSVRLENLLGGGIRVYNMGISGCHLPQTLQYLPRTLEVFKEPPRLLLIEAHDLSITEEQAEQILSSQVPSIYTPKPDWQKQVLSLPYMRLLAQQKNLGLPALLNPPRKPASAEDYEMPGEPFPEDAPEGVVYDPIFSVLRQLQEAYQVKILIFYQPTEKLQKDGSVLFPQDPWIHVFEGKCRENGIGFLDMTEKFQEMYRKEHRLPHGFLTGRIGTGHLNADGHRAIAEAAAQWIREEEGA